MQPAKVNLVEASFPQMKDLLKGGTLDAVAVLEPFRSRIVADQTGYRLADYVAEVNPDLLGGVWVARRDQPPPHETSHEYFFDTPSLEDRHRRPGHAGGHAVQGLAPLAGSVTRFLQVLPSLLTAPRGVQAAHANTPSACVLSVTARRWP